MENLRREDDPWPPHPRPDPHPMRDPGEVVKISDSTDESLPDTDKNPPQAA